GKDEETKSSREARSWIASSSGGRWIGGVSPDSKRKSPPVKPIRLHASGAGSSSSRSWHAVGRFQVKNRAIRLSTCSKRSEEDASGSDAVLPGRSRWTTTTAGTRPPSAAPSPSEAMGD